MKDYEVVIPLLVRTTSPEDAVIEAEVAIRNHIQAGVPLVAKVIQHSGAVTEGFDGTWHDIMGGGDDDAASA
jgi:hypothetical protein